jgi:hypothetical protein
MKCRRPFLGAKARTFIGDPLKQDVTGLDGHLLDVIVFELGQGSEVDCS